MMCIRNTEKREKQIIFFEICASTSHKIEWYHNSTTRQFNGKRRQKPQKDCASLLVWNWFLFKALGKEIGWGLWGWNYFTHYLSVCLCICFHLSYSLFCRYSSYRRALALLFRPHYCCCSTAFNHGAVLLVLANGSEKETNFYIIRYNCYLTRALHCTEKEIHIFAIYKAAPNCKHPWRMEDHFKFALFC